MPSTPEEARADLEHALAAGLDISITPQALESGRPVRRSAVLILFGALDDVPCRVPDPAVPPTLDVLLTRRADSMRHHAGQIAFPGGGVEPGDADAAATALREAWEETGLDPSGVDVLGTLPEIWVPVSSNLVTPVVGWWRLPSAVAADRTESVEVFRVPVAELLDPAARGTSVLSRAGAEFRGEAFRLDGRFGGRVVWGFTGMLLARLFAEIGWGGDWDRAREFPVLP